MEAVKNLSDSTVAFLKSAPDATRSFLRLAPVQDGEGFKPSPFATMVAVPKKTDYAAAEYPTKYTGSSKVLVVACEEKYMTMENGKKFSTGNHPVETFVPLRHLLAAGFDYDICTPTGKPVAIEEWALPSEDSDFTEFYEAQKPKLEKPLSLVDIAASLSPSSPYLAVFIPGGHGAMSLGLPENNQDLAKLIAWCNNEADDDKYVISLCHGPAALLSAVKEGEDNFVYKGYKMAVFPDLMDKSVQPLLGYLPGYLPWYVGEKLQAAGVEIVNKMATGTVHQDRRLLTGDSPAAANGLGALAAQTLLEATGTVEAASANTEQEKETQQ